MALEVALQRKEKEFVGSVILCPVRGIKAPLSHWLACRSAQREAAEQEHRTSQVLWVPGVRMLKRKFPKPEASGSPRAKRARQLDRDRESLQQRGHRVARSQVEGIPSAWRLQVFDRESLVEPGTQIN